MTLPPFEEFMKSITPVVQDNRNIEDVNDCKRFTDVLVKGKRQIKPTFTE